ncbi:MAG: 50S ribosomal protein L21 [Bacteroidetes bacterium]|nr:50S ribosomal protein L21 [Bacteroidota bacterium]
MFAIVDICGQQFKVEKNAEIFVHRLEEAVDTHVEFDHVLLLDDDGKTSVGKPFVDGVKVSALVLDHVKGDKVTVFKKKRRKGFQKETGHRQYFSKIRIENILTGGEAKAKTRKAKAKKDEETTEPQA